MNPRFPVYVVSHKRSKMGPPTVKTLDQLGVPHTVIVEPSDLQEYAGVIPESELRVVPESFHESYEDCDDLGRTKSQGPGPARNYAWEDSIKRGFEWHWVMDDNITQFHRNHNNRRYRVTDGTCFRAMEDFVLRYANVGMAGPNYSMFMYLTDHGLPPFTINTRIYSCNLIKNDLPYRWRGRYNEDTDLSLRILKSGLCTIQFNAFAQLKVPTQTYKGGNTDEFYSKEGTLPKSLMQVRLHPDVSRLVFKFSRWHHQIDYSRFKRNRLVLRKDAVIPKGVNDYGMTIREKTRRSGVS